MDKAVIKHMIDQCSDFTDRLTEWEAQFLESISDQFDRNGSLSDKQAAILEGIYDKLP
jgi:hypothetical protein